MTPRSTSQHVHEIYPHYALKGPIIYEPKAVQRQTQFNPHANLGRQMRTLTSPNLQRRVKQTLATREGARVCILLGCGITMNTARNHNSDKCVNDHQPSEKAPIELPRS